MKSKLDSDQGEVVRISARVVDRLAAGDASVADEVGQHHHLVGRHRGRRPRRRNSSGDSDAGTGVQLVKAQPDNWLSLELKGWVQREAGDYTAAAKTYEDVLERINKDDSLKDEDKKDFGSDIHYSLSNIYLELKKIDKVAEHLPALVEAAATISRRLGARP